MMGAAIGAFVLGALASATPSAFPGGGPRVVVTSAAEASPLVREAAKRIVAELEARGVSAREGPPRPGRDRRGDLVEAARTTSAWVAIGVWATNADEVEVWTFDVVERQLVVLPIDVRPGVATNPALVVAVRAAELLRATFIEVPGRPTPAPASANSAPPALPARSEAPPGARRFSVTLAAGAFRDVGAAGTSFAPALGLAVNDARWGGRIAVFGLGSAMRVRAAAGEAVLTPAVALVELTVRPWDRAVAPELALGAGAKHLRIAGEAAAPLEGATSGLWTAVASAGAGARLALAPWLALTGELRVLAAARAPRLRLRDELTEPRGRVSSWMMVGLAGAY